jgi:hypothetical protein
MSGFLRQRSAGSWELKFEAPPDAAGKRKTVYRTFRARGTRRKPSLSSCKTRPPRARSSTIPERRLARS